MTSNRQSRIDALIMLPPEARAVSRHICENATSTSKGEGVEPTVGTDIKPVVSSQQGLEVSLTGHRLLWPAAGKQRLAVVTAETVQPIVAFGAEYPNDRIRPAVGGRDDRRAFAAQGAAPGRGERGRRARANLQDRQPLASTRLRAMRTLSLEGHIDPVAGAIGCWRREDMAGRYGLGNEAAADPPRAGSIEAGSARRPAARPE